MTLPINTTACAHAHLTPILDAIRAKDPEVVVTSQITPPDIERSSIGRPHEAYITFTVDGLKVEATVKADGSTPRYRMAQNPGDFTLEGYKIEIRVNYKAERVPLKKDGTFNYERIANAVLSSARGQQNELDRQGRSETRTGAYGDLVEALNTKARDTGSGYVFINDKKSDNPIRVSIHGFQRAATPEAAKELVDFLADWFSRNEER